MGRLFWKFFLFFWLAQMVTSTGVGFAFWALRGAHERPPVAEAGRHADGQPPPPPPHHRPPPRSAFPPPLLPLVAGSVVSLLFAALLARYFARPIRNLNKAFKAVADGALETRVGPRMDRRDELADLGGQFDHMAERLQNLIRSQQRLLHDVSHELRSPLARLQAAVDLMRQQPERGPALLGRIERESERMDALIGELLTLARLDAGSQGSFDEPVAIDELLDRVVDDVGFEAEASGGKVVRLPGPVVHVLGNDALLHRCIENIVRNAVQHGPEQGVDVAVSTTMADQGCTLVICVADNGPGVPEDALQSIFDPFFRCPQGRSTSGYGLGLAIAQRIAAAHGGTVMASNRAGGGLMVCVQLPVRGPSSLRPSFSS